MSMPDHPAPMFDAADEEVTRYRAVSSLALAGLLAGLLSPLAMWTAVLWLVPLVAVAVPGWHAADRGPLAGTGGTPRGLGRAVAGDGIPRRRTGQRSSLSLLRPPAGPRNSPKIRIDAVRNGEVFKAHHLMLEPRQAPSLGQQPGRFITSRTRSGGGC